MKKVFKLVLVLTCTTSLFFVGCRKKETTEVDNETQSAVDNAVADQEYMSIVPAVNNHAINTKGTGATANGRIMATCDSLVLISGDTAFSSPTHVAPTFTMNISNSACNLTLPDGKLRAGTLKIKLLGRIKKPGSKMIINMVNYNASGISYSCDSMIVTTGDTSATFTKFNIKLWNGVCQNPNWTIKYKFDRNITMYPKGNPVNTDPVAEVYGSANGINRTGKAFTVDIPAGSPLVKHKGCQFIDKGILNLTPEGFKTRIVDFGNGACDDDATFTVNGSTVAFKLK